MSHIKVGSNGQAPYTVVIDDVIPGAVIWFSCQTREQAEAKLETVRKEAARPDGIIEYDVAQIILN